MPIRCTPGKSDCSCLSLCNQRESHKLSLIPMRHTPGSDSNFPSTGFLGNDSPERSCVFPTFLHPQRFLKDMCGCRFPTVLHFSHGFWSSARYSSYPSIATDLWSLSHALDSPRYNAGIVPPLHSRPSTSSQSLRYLLFLSLIQ